QRDQGRNHNADTVTQQSRNLVTERLAAAGRHQHQRIAACGHMLDNGLLRTAKGGITENILQNTEGVFIGVQWCLLDLLSKHSIARISRSIKQKAACSTCE